MFPRPCGLQIPRDGLDNLGFQISVFLFFFPPVSSRFVRQILHFQGDITQFPGHLILGIEKPCNRTRSLYITVHSYKVGLTFHFFLAKYILFILTGRWGWGRVVIFLVLELLSSLPLSLSSELSKSKSAFN